MPEQKSKRHRIKTSRTPQILILAGVALLVIMLLIFKQTQNSSDGIKANAGELPAVQLDRALLAGQPALAFFHSDNCEQCIVMMEIVARVHPEFSNKVTLVDVNVYDENNAELLRSVGLQYIPTLIFFDRTGKGQVSVGVMEDDLLRQTLADLAAGG
jgi:thiol:disulfide interchange protein